VGQLERSTSARSDCYPPSTIPSLIRSRVCRGRDMPATQPRASSYGRPRAASMPHRAASLLHRVGAPLVATLVAQGCLLSWERTDGSGGGGGGGEDCVQKTCSPASTCACEGGCCEFSCANISCDVECGAATSCSVSCSGASCRVSCGASDECSVTCDGGNCDVSGGTADVVELSCNAASGSLSCENADQCSLVNTLASCCKDEECSG
jgi:hypothetical protein